MKSLSSLFSHSLRHRVMPMPAPGMAFGYTLYAQPKALSNPMLLYGLLRVLATGGGKPATWWE